MLVYNGVHDKSTATKPYVDGLARRGIVIRRCKFDGVRALTRTFGLKSTACEEEIVNYCCSKREKNFYGTYFALKRFFTYLKSTVRSNVSLCYAQNLFKKYEFVRVAFNWNPI